MAGVAPDAGFDEQFRADIREVMLMGTPTVVEDRPTFLFMRNRIVDGGDGVAADRFGVPYDWNIADEYIDESGGPVEDPDREPVQVLVAFDPGAMSDVKTAVTVVNDDSGHLYMFEDEWAEVKDFTHVNMGGSMYRRVARMVPLGLYGVQVEVIRIEAVDET